MNQKDFSTDLLSIGTYLTQGGRESDEAIYECARTHYEDGQYADALPILFELLAQRPYDANVHKLCGYTLRALGDPTAALPYLCNAVMLDPDDPMSTMQAAYALQEAGATAAAIDTARMVIEQSYEHHDHAPIREEAERFMTAVNA